MQKQAIKKGDKIMIIKTPYTSSSYWKKHIGKCFVVQGIDNTHKTTTDPYYVSILVDPESNQTGVLGVSDVIPAKNSIEAAIQKAIIELENL